jgi:hypothetical protein
MFVTPGNGAAATILITGAIGDYGKTLTIDKNGKTDSNGNYVKMTLREGEQLTADLIQGDLLGAALCNRSGDAIQRYRSLQGNHRDAEHHRNLRLYRSSLHERGE